MKKNKKPIVDPVLRRFYLPTQDNWSGNYPRNTVMISVYCWDCTNGVHAKYYPAELVMFKVSVWGNDDTGMDIEFLAPAKEKEYWSELLLKEVDRFPNPLNKDWLIKNGFQYA